MGITSRYEYLNQIQHRYHCASKTQKKSILDEFCAVCNYNRKYAIRLLKAPAEHALAKNLSKRGRKKTYHDPLLLEVLWKIWITANHPCAKRLKALLPLWLPHFEAEKATYTGQGAVIKTAIVSGGAYLEMRDAWTLTFNNVSVASAGEYLLSIAYQLTFESPKSQYLVINGDTLTTIEFISPSTTAWLQRGLKIPLLAGTNVIAIHGFWNWMSFDYIGVSGATVAVSVEDANAELPKTVALVQNYPNPFNPGTTITYTLPRTGHVQLEVFDLLGKHVATLVDEKKTAGSYTVKFEAKNAASGVYFYRLKVDAETVMSKRMVLVR